MNLLADLEIDSDTVVMISSDHGETLGELNVYGDHQTADQLTTRVPLILRWPGKLEAARFAAKHYQVDVAATILELLGAPVPERWDGQSFAQELKAGRDEGREELVLSQLVGLRAGTERNSSYCPATSRVEFHQSREYSSHRRGCHEMRPGCSDKEFHQCQLSPCSRGSSGIRIRLPGQGAEPPLAPGAEKLRGRHMTKLRLALPDPMWMSH